MNDDWSIFEPPDKHQLTRHADDLIHRAKLVRRHGWDQYRHIWSCGEVIGTALLLVDDAELQRCGETEISALERWAFDLWGITGGQYEIASREVVDFGSGVAHALRSTSHVER